MDSDFRIKSQDKDKIQDQSAEESISHGALRTGMWMLSRPEARRLLQETLEEEMWDRKLAELAEQNTSREALAA